MLIDVLWERFQHWFFSPGKLHRNKSFQKHWLLFQMIKWTNKFDVNRKLLMSDETSNQSPTIHWALFTHWRMCFSHDTLPITFRAVIHSSDDSSKYLMDEIRLSAFIPILSTQSLSNLQAIIRVIAHHKFNKLKWKKQLNSNLVIIFVATVYVLNRW